MKSSGKTILKWCVGVSLLLLFVGGLLLPCSNCPGNAARRVEARNLMMQLDSALHAYKEEYGSFPSGNPKEIVSELTGENPHNIEFMMLRARNLNETGELIDFWKTPFRFDRISETEAPQLISAGPDKIFGTPDDVTLTSP